MNKVEPVARQSSVEQKLNQPATQPQTKEPTHPSFPVSQQPPPFTPPSSVKDDPKQALPAYIVKQNNQPLFQKPTPTQVDKAQDKPTEQQDIYAVEKRGVDMDDFMPVSNRVSRV